MPFTNAASLLENRLGDFIAFWGLRAVASDMSNQPTPEQIKAGQAVYTPRTLQIYDFLVLFLSNRFIWRCPTPYLVEHYDRHVSGNHLDVGVGTGYFLDHCRFPVERPRIALMDLNQNTLDYAARRIVRHALETYLANVLEPIDVHARPFDSLGLNYLLHCLPGPLESKSVVFDHLLPYLNPGATVFGSTLLHGGVQRGLLARWLMSNYNRKGIFSNEQDSLDVLQQELAHRFNHVSITVRGCVALFSAQVRSMTSAS